MDHTKIFSDWKKKSSLTLKKIRKIRFQNHSTDKASKEQCGVSSKYVTINCQVTNKQDDKS